MCGTRPRRSAVPGAPSGPHGSNCGSVPTLRQVRPAWQRRHHPGRHGHRVPKARRYRRPGRRARQSSADTVRCTASWQVLGRFDPNGRRQRASHDGLPWNPLGFPTLPCHHGVAKQPDAGRPGVPRSPPFDTEGPEQSGPFVFPEVISPSGHRHLSWRGLLACPTAATRVPYGRFPPDHRTVYAALRSCPRSWRISLFPSGPAILPFGSRRFKGLIEERGRPRRASVAVPPRDSVAGVAVPPKDFCGPAGVFLPLGEANVAVLPNEAPWMRWRKESGPWIRWRIGRGLRRANVAVLPVPGGFPSISRIARADGGENIEAYQAFGHLGVVWWSPRHGRTETLPTAVRVQKDGLPGVGPVARSAPWRV